MKTKMKAALLAGAMLVSLSISALAVPTMTQDWGGQGSLSNDLDIDIVDISVPAHGFFWYANQDTANGTNRYDLLSSDYEIVNNSARTTVTVSLDAYKVAAGGLSELSSYENMIQLNLTGALGGNMGVSEQDRDNTSPTYGEYIWKDAGNKLGQDMLRTNTYTGTYYKYLEADDGTNSDNNVWTYGFDGSYQGALPTGGAVSDYVMTLTFDAIAMS